MIPVLVEVERSSNEEKRRKKRFTLYHKWMLDLFIATIYHRSGNK